MNNLPQIFNYNENQIRVTMIDGQPWWVAKEISDLLDITNSREAMNRLDDDEKRLLIGKESLVGLTDDPNTTQLTVINEPGLYSLILASRKPEAKNFKRWITHEVIPAIRQTGSYSVQYQLPQTYSEALRALADEAERREEAEKQVAIMAPKAEFFDAVADSKDAIAIGDAAKVLNCGIGRNKLFAFLRKKSVLMNNNVPYQEFVDRGYFRIIEQKYTTPDGETRISIKTLVYQKGLDYIRKLVIGETRKLAVVN